MDWPSIITSIISGLVLAALVGGVAIARNQALKVCGEITALTVEAQSAKNIAQATQMQTTEKFNTIAGRLDDLRTDVHELRSAMMRGEGR